MANIQNVSFQSPFAEIDQQFKVNRWQNTPSNQTQNRFMRYTTTNQSNQQVDGIRFASEQQHQRTYTTEVNQPSYADKFKKIKYSQLQTLKELRQEYEILKNLPLQDQFLKRSHVNKQSVSNYSSRRDDQSSSSPSIHVSKKKNREVQRESHRESHSTARDNQVLSMQKRQLQLVIGNSMRKIQELLNNQIEYKKIIHQQQLQLDSRNNDGKLDSMAKTMKKNQSQYIEKITNLQRDIQRLKLINQQLVDKYDSVQAELLIRNQELRKIRQQKRIVEDSIRLQKDKYMNLQIDNKRIKMQNDINEKDKNNQINRLKALLESQPKIDNNAHYQIRRLEEQLRASKNKYQIILQQFQRYKKDIGSRPPKQVIIKQDNRGQDQIRVFQAIINHLKEDSANQSRATIDLLASMVAKIDQRNSKERQQSKQKKKGKQIKEPTNPKQLQASKRILQQMYNLRNQVNSLRKQREDPNKSIQFYSNLTQSVALAEYQNKIRKLQDQITDGTISKQNLLKQYQILKSSYQYAKDEYDKIINENQKLKERITQLEHHGQNFNQQIKGNFRQRQTQYQDTIRHLKRQLEQSLFMVDKCKKEGEFNVGLVRGQYQAKIRLAQQRALRVQGQKEVLRQELIKMRGYYETKIKEKNEQIQRTAQQYAVLCQGKQKTLAQFKTRSEAQMVALVQKIEGIASLNERYLLQSNQLSNAQRQLHELRYAIRKMKGMNEGVDHLWQIKQTQYLNLNQLLKQTRIT